MSSKLKVRKTVISLLAVIILVIAAVGGTYAYLQSTASVVNTMTPGDVDITIDEELEGAVKKSVTIKNTGNVDAYVRAYVVINYVDEDGNVCAEHSAVSFTPANGWVAGSDGYYYYPEMIAPGASTPSLVDPITLDTATDGCTMQVIVTASAVQGHTFDGYQATWAAVQNS